MATNWVCPVCGSLPGDNGSDTSKTNNVVGTTATGDVNGNPPHCPMCGTAQLVAVAATIATATGVSSGSQHPANIDAVYVTATDAQNAQAISTSVTLTGLPPKYIHGYAVLKRGDQTITAETVNSTVGP